MWALSFCPTRMESLVNFLLLALYVGVANVGVVPEPRACSLYGTGCLIPKYRAGQEAKLIHTLIFYTLSPRQEHNRVPVPPDQCVTKVKLAQWVNHLPIIVENLAPLLGLVLLLFCWRTSRAGSYGTRQAKSHEYPQRGLHPKHGALTAYILQETVIGSNTRTVGPHPNTFVNNKINSYHRNQNESLVQILAKSVNNVNNKRTKQTLHWRVKSGAPEKWGFPVSHVTSNMLSCVSPSRKHLNKIEVSKLYTVPK